VGDRGVAEKATAASLNFRPERCFLAEGLVSRPGTENQKIDLSRFSNPLIAKSDCLFYAVKATGDPIF
jgi:hypothetical protein